MIHHDFVTPRITSYDKSLYRRFLDDNGNFEEFHYRRGAAYTAFFGIAAGWGENFTPGYVRVHIGVDRARGGSITHGQKSITDIVISPMNFDSSNFIDYGNRSYGSLAFLINRKYGFEMRVAHMDPTKDFIPWSLQQLKLRRAIKKGWYLGSAGTYGYSTAAHTHTELVSHDESSEVLELMLLEKHGDKIYRQYTDERIVDFYKGQARKYPNTSPYADWSDGQILNDWTNLKARRNIFFINDYKICFFWNSRPLTRYATDKTLKGL